MRERDTMRFCRGAIERSPLPMVAVKDATHIIVSMNAAFRRLVGKEQNALIGRPLADVLPERKSNQCLPLVDRVYRTGLPESLADQEHLASHSNRVYWSYALWAIGSAEEHPVGVMIQITDTTEATLFRRKMISLNEELQQSEVRLQALAATDGLTGLPNHRTFQARLREEIARAARYSTPLSVLLVDVDHFKGYNDTYGHPAGDAALRDVGKVLQSAARTHDLVARYGGEEFAVILPETDTEGAMLAAERFRAAIQTAVWQERQITISLGAATLSSTLRDPAILIREADKALYRSKRRGRNCVTHSMDLGS